MTVYDGLKLCTSLSENNQLKQRIIRHASHIPGTHRHAHAHFFYPYCQTWEHSRLSLQGFFFFTHWCTPVLEKWANFFLFSLRNLKMLPSNMLFFTRMMHAMSLTPGVTFHIHLLKAFLVGVHASGIDVHVQDVWVTLKIVWRTVRVHFHHESPCNLLIGLRIVGFVFTVAVNDLAHSYHRSNHSNTLRLILH